MKGDAQMTTPGIANPYWYEWYVGLKYIIQMLNPDSGISSVTFQHGSYDTIDDVVVEFFDNNKQQCFQVKHEISSATSNNLTFGKMLESVNGKKCLFEAMLLGWSNASKSSTSSIKPILYTNRKVTNRRAGRSVNGIHYSAYPIDQFVSKMQVLINSTNDLNELQIDDQALKNQWDELCSTLHNYDPSEILSFLRAFVVEGNQPGLGELEQSLIASLAEVIGCNNGLASDLFNKLLRGLTVWTTTIRKNEQVTVEEVYNCLGVDNNVDDSQHRLVPPEPFFESRYSFCKELVKTIETSRHKVVFLSGEPGSGKTSTVSFLQSQYNLFTIRFHTFKPISPDQHFYNSDPGMCTPENLWGTLLIQLRKKFKGRMAAYKVPVCNELITLEQMREHVLRLLGVLAQERANKDKRLYVCIDGIDHAARSNIPLSFLGTLPLLDEIPDGVCFVLVGQPTAMYHDQYPLWLSVCTEIERVSIPKLTVKDIQQLVCSRAKQFAEVSKELSEAIHQKTEGNNLSVVYAIEEIRLVNAVEDAVQVLQKGICGDIQQYYNYIWLYMKKELAVVAGGIVYPESVVACSLLLMNGRVDTRILSLALQNGMSSIDWSMILNRLYPLVIHTENEEEYMLFHNDFRVFLMGVIQPYQSQYKDIAFSLAKYFLQNNVGILSFVRGIPLLQCAEKQAMIPKFFTAKFVIDGLAEGISRKRLDEFAQLAYDEACKNHDYEGYCNVYYAIKTIHQHIRYFEYYQKEYKCNDYAELTTIDLSEVRILPLEKNNFEEYNSVLSLCDNLFLSGIEDFKSRATTLFHRWFDNISPRDVVLLCKDEFSDEDWWTLKGTEIGVFLQKWGITAARLNIPLPTKADTLPEQDEYAYVLLGEQYYIGCIEQEKYSLALEAIKKGYVSQSVFFEKLDNIYYSGASKSFIEILERVSNKADKPLLGLQAMMMCVTCSPGYIPSIETIQVIPDVIHIYDESCFQLTLMAFIIGRIRNEKDDNEVISAADLYSSKIEGADYKKQQIVNLCRVAALLGKHYWSEHITSSKLTGYLEWFLTAKLRRVFDYSRAYKFILFTLLRSNGMHSFGKTPSFINALRYNLFEVNQVGMYYKTFILDYLIENEQLEIVDGYIQKLYGEGCSAISREPNKADMHAHFGSYGTIVKPELMRRFSEQLKWDVVGYIEHKEDAMCAPLDLYNMISQKSPIRWKDLGKQLFSQSVFANLAENEVEYEIYNSIQKSAINSGLEDYWAFRELNDEFRLSPDMIYHALFDFIRCSVGSEDLKVIWILNCGIHSWYTQEERIGTSAIYDACLKKAEEFHFDFSSFVNHITPQWFFILEQGIAINNATDSSHTKKNAEDYLKQYDALTLHESIESLRTFIGREQYVDFFNIVLKKALKQQEEHSEVLLQMLSYFCKFYEEKDWRRERIDETFSRLSALLGDKVFWALAETQSVYLCEYDYYTSTRNIQWLLQQKCRVNSTEAERLFIDELYTQKMWVTGNNHLDISVEEENGIAQFQNVPKYFGELAAFILLEQMNSSNARKMEIAIYAIYLLGNLFPQMVYFIVSKWPILTQLQQECLLPVVAKWAVDKNNCEVLCQFVQETYDSCDELVKKYYLHSILLLLNCRDVAPDRMTYSAPWREYKLPTEGFEEKESYYERFLSLVQLSKRSGDINAIRRFISCIPELLEYKEDQYTTLVDECLPVINPLPGMIFYDAESRGMWSDIPLSFRKARLLPMEDPFILTEMPTMTFDGEWFLTDETSYGCKKEIELTIKQLHDISHDHIRDNEIVLAACLWYPYGYDDGAIYTKTTQIDYWNCNHRNAAFDYAIGNYGLLVNNYEMEETRFSKISGGGWSLFDVLVGRIKLKFGNCQIVPSNAWVSIMGCKPKTDDPFTWIDRNGKAVLRFERIASPIRELMREAYIRQPILFRWICDENWLQCILKEKELCLYPLEKNEPYPKAID